MRVRQIILALLLLPTVVATSFADKGMWVLRELNQQNIDRMRELGFTMELDDLYSLEKPSLANSVVIFGRGCTGVTVSDQGLIFTNHHCGYDAIQSQSSVEHDYLQDGFVSHSFEAELPIPGLTVSYLVNMVDVTDRIESAVKGIDNEMMRIGGIQTEMQKIEEEYSSGDFVVAEVVPFYEGNKYYVVVYNVFRDVRLVLAPPSSVGKFGGDTDNWMYPRHTGDFSVFRAYADANNNPAHYSASNRPYKPVSFAKVSLNGYKPGDYAMTIGFPGSTNRYLTSWAIEDLMENEHNPRIEVRGAKQEIWKKAMDADQATRIKYAAKYSQSSNYWKNAIGMNRGIENLDVVARKETEQRAFTKWYQQTGKTAQYGNLLSELERDYKAAGKYNRQFTYLYETLYGGTEVGMLALRASRILALDNLESEMGKAMISSLKDAYKDYSPELDRKVLPAMLDLMRKNGGEELLPNLYKTIDKKFKGSSQRYSENLFEKSVIPYQEKLQELLAMTPKKRERIIKKDPAMQLLEDMSSAMSTIRGNMMEANLNINKNKRIYFAAMQEKDPDVLMPSDANFTMRMSYGSVAGYAPFDGAYYKHYTTQDGIFQKENPNVGEFAVQPEILELLRKGDFGDYGVGKNLHICFLSSNDITGGNSGSPVFDKNGDLIGLAFDGNWEAMSGDIEFEPELQRTINVDIRYVMFMIDKWGKCSRLVKELTFVPKEETTCPSKRHAYKAKCPHAKKATCKDKKECATKCDHTKKAGCDAKKAACKDKKECKSKQSCKAEKRSNAA